MHWSHEKGYRSESRVESHLEELGHQVWASRFRTPYAELDLVTRRESEFWLIEVKSLSARGFAETRLSRRQKERLRHARDWFENKYGGDVSLVLAWVEESGKIELFILTADDLR